MLETGRLVLSPPGEALLADPRVRESSLGGVRRAPGPGRARGRRVARAPRLLADRKGDRRGSVAWVRTVDESEATGLVKTYYDAFIKQRGWVPNILQVHSIRPDTLRAFMGMENAFMHGRGAGLTRVQREMIAIVVSVANRCHF